MNVGADACVVGSLCSVLSLFVCSVSLCACVRVESSVCLFSRDTRSLYEPSIYLSFHRDSFLFALGLQIQ